VATQRSARPGPAARSGTSKLPLVLAGVGVLVVAVLIGVFTASDRPEARATVAEVAGEPVMTGEDLPRFEGDPATDPAVGTRPPVVTGASFDGEEVVIGESGRPQLLMFLASWCPACQAELPEVVEWLEQGNLPEGVELIAVATGLDSSRDNWPPDEWFDREGYDGPLLVDDADGTVAQAYGLNATPYWVALDGDGEVAVRIAGMIDTQQLSALADALAAS
jgi:cytochrome c biogenesis protein CcmG, thiol:disulfide interchange protein DsbE